MPLLERTKLYKDVWSRPCTKIAAGLGISSSALKRICTEMDIPTPVAGYWTRVVSHQSSHAISNQTAKNDLVALESKGLPIRGKIRKSVCLPACCRSRRKVRWIGADGYSRPLAQRDSEITGQQYRKLYSYREYLDVLNEDTL